MDDLGVPSVGISEDLPRGPWDSVQRRNHTLLVIFTHVSLFYLWSKVKRSNTFHLPMVVLSMFYLWLYLCFTFDLLHIDLPIFSGDEYPLIPAFWGSPGYQGFDPWPIAIESGNGFKPREGKCRADTIFSPCHEGLPQRPTDRMIRRWRW